MYPLGLRLTGRKVLVVGGGAVAHRRVPRLLDAGADVVLVSPEVHTSLEGLAEAGALRWEPRAYRESDMDDAWLVLAATDDRAVNTLVGEHAEARRVFCVRSDDADAATAWTPAVARHERLSVAAFADGDPRRAASLRDAVADLFDTGRLGAPPFRQSADSFAGTVALVGAGPGDVDLITVAGRRLLYRADVVIADRLGPAGLLENLDPDVEIVDVGKIPYGRQTGQDEITRRMIDHAAAGRFVVRLKGGDGFVFGRGGEELDALAAAGLTVHVVPGVSSALAAPAAAGAPVTERGLTHDFTVVSGHLAPDDPASLTDWDALARMRGTLVLLMAVRHLRAIVDALTAGGKDPATPALAVMDATTSRERVVRADLATIADADVTSPAVIVIGRVARFPR